MIPYTLVVPRPLLHSSSRYSLALIVITSLFLLAGHQTRGATPSLSLTAPGTAYVDEAILVDGRASAGVSRMPQADGRPSVTIDFGDGFTANLLASAHAYRAPGTYTITITGRDAAGATASVSSSITVSSIPSASGINLQVLADTGNPVTNAANLQAAIERAAAQNWVAQEVVLPAGAVFAGVITLTTPVGSSYITIRSAALTSLPGPGNRVGPADAWAMAVITAPAATNQTLPAMWTTPSQAPPTPTHHYRLQGIHFRKDSDAHFAQALLALGDFNAGQNTTAETPHHFIVERCYLDGGSATSTIKDGLRLAADQVTVADSYIGPFQIVSGADATAISVSKSSVHAVWNTYLEASSENFMYGANWPVARDVGQATISAPTTTSCTLSTVAGLEVDMNVALPVGGSYGPDQTAVVRSISGTQVTYDPLPQAPDAGGVARWAHAPSFLEFRRNHLRKPLRWRQSDPSWDGSNWQIKNLWETKWGRYGVMDANVMENSWIKHQQFAIVLTPRNASGGEHPAVVVRELQFSNNILRNLANGVSILPSDTQGGGNPTQRTSDITLRGNVFWNVGENWEPTNGQGRQFITYLPGMTADDHPVRIHVIHNTFDNGLPDNSRGTITDFGADGGARQSTWKNNVAQHAGYGFRSSIYPSHDIVSNLNRFLPAAGGENWDGNLVANVGGALYPVGARRVYPGGSWARMFRDYGGGDFTLVDGSPGKWAALDGSDMGVEMAGLRVATLHTVDGQWGTGPPPAPTPTPTPAPPPAPGGKGEAVWTALISARSLAGGGVEDTGAAYYAKAQTSQTISGSGYFEWTFDGDLCVVGLGNQNDEQLTGGFSDLEFAFSFGTASSFEVYERGAYRRGGAASVGDVFRIEVAGQWGRGLPSQRGGGAGDGQPGEGVSLLPGLQGAGAGWPLHQRGAVAGVGRVANAYALASASAAQAQPAKDKSPDYSARGGEYAS